MENKARKKNLMSKMINIILGLITIVYILAVLKIIVFKSGFTTGLRSLNLKPFGLIKDLYLENENLDVILKNILGNFALFIPMGILIPSLFKKVDMKKSVIICFFVSLSFEIIQYIFGIGLSDIDDLILNTLGGFIGTLIYFKCLKKVDKKLNMRISTVCFLSVFGICGVISLYLYQPNMLPAQIKFVNKEILNGLDISNSDVEGLCLEVYDNSFKVDIEKRFFRDDYINRNIDGIYELEKDAQFFLEEKEFKYSPNGNVQKIKITYSKISKEQFKKIIEEKELSINFWTSQDNKCKNVVIRKFLN